MFNPDKDFNRILFDSLGRDGKSISSLAKDLESKGFKHHRLILTGYLRALTDMGMLREREVPPSKVYVVSKQIPDSLYESVGKACRKISDDPDEMILFALSKILRRPVFESELRYAGVTRPIGVPASEQEVVECRKIMKRAGNIVPNQSAVNSSHDFNEAFPEILSSVLLNITDSRHLMMETKQVKLL